MRIFRPKPAVVLMASLLVAFFFIGCASVETLQKADLKSIGPDEGGALVIVRLKDGGGSLPSDGCDLNLRETDGSVSYPVSINVGKQISFIELRPGIYRLFSLNCGRARTWEFRYDPKNILAIFDKKITVLAPLQFDLGDTLTLHADVMPKFKENKDLYEAYLNLSGEARLRTVSSPSGKYLDLTQFYTRQ